MKTLAFVSATLAIAGFAAPVMAAPMQPPMGQFYEAFYTCSPQGEFQMSYNSESPKQVTMITSNNNAKYSLTRVPVATGVQFASGQVEFWTDGKSVIVRGTKIPLNGCQLKSKS